MESLFEKHINSRGLGRSINMRPSYPHETHYVERLNSSYTNGVGLDFVATNMLPIPRYQSTKYMSISDVGGRLAMS